MLRHQGFSITGVLTFYIALCICIHMHTSRHQGFSITRGSYFLYMAVYMYLCAHVLTSGVIHYKGFLLLHLYIRSLTYGCVYVSMITRASYLVAGLAPRLSFLCFSFAFPKVLFTSGAMIPVPRFAVICAAAMRGIECVYFTGVPAHLHHKGFLPGGWLGSLPAFPLLFLCYS